MKKILDAMDFIFNKAIPKKFLIVTVATVIVFMKLDPPSEYWYLLIAYFGGNVAMKFIPKEK